MLADTVCLLVFDCTVELFLLKESLKKGHHRLNSLIVKHFAAQYELVPVAPVVGHVVPLERKPVQRFRDDTRRKKLGNVEHFLETVQMHVWRGQ